MSRERRYAGVLTLVARRSAFAAILALFALCSSAVAATQKAKAPSNDDCIACHGDASATRENGSSIAVLPEVFGKSVHGPMSCVDCHVDLTAVADFPHAAKAKEGRLRLVP